jgi:2-phospho-L-lactate guanylyltransferase
MGTWAIVPVKNLSEAKSSLAPSLAQQHRKELVLRMLHDVLNALAAVPVETLVVSPDDAVLDFAGKLGAAGLKEPGVGLNGALELGARYASSRGADSILILPADLPLLRPGDVERILASAPVSRSVVIAPSKSNGTNALYLSPPGVMALRFGGESFPEHLAEARMAGIEPKIYRSSTLEFDVDEPQDLLRVLAEGMGTKTFDFLLSLKEAGVLREQVNPKGG